MILKSLIVGALLGLSCNVFAEDIAQCSNPKGKSYYPELGIMSKNDSGWNDDGITGGLGVLTLRAIELDDIAIF